jgi:TPR repeat protein
LEYDCLREGHETPLAFCDAGLSVPDICRLDTRSNHCGKQRGPDLLYQNGGSVKQDYIRAAAWYRNAAEHVPDLGGAG